VFLGRHGNVVEDAVFLGRCAMLLGNCRPAFETTTLPRNVEQQTPSDAAPDPRRICDHNIGSFTRPGNWGWFFLTSVVGDLIQRERRKRGRPRKTWMEGVQAAMTTGNLEPDQWRNREEWRLVSERRQQLKKTDR